HDLLIDLVHRGNVAANAAVEVDWFRSIERELDVFDHLPGRELDDHDGLSLCSGCCERFGWERPQSDWPEKSDLDSTGSGVIDGGAKHSGNDSVTDDENICIIGEVSFPTLLGRGTLVVLFFEMADVGLEKIGRQMNGADEILLRRGSSANGPGLCGLRNLFLFDLERFHHLSDESIGKDDGRVAIFVREFEGEDGERIHLLHRCWREHDVAIAAVSTTFDHGEVIALLGRDVAESGTAANHVDDHCGKLGTGDIGHSLLHERNARAGGAGHYAFAR